MTTQRFNLISPTVRNNARAGIRQAPRFISEVALKYDGEPCLTWPYARNSAGYGHIRRDGRNYLVSRLVCEETHGAPPSPKHYAIHTCGNGHLACCNPRHLRWASPKENSRDALEHGTRRQGQLHYAAKLTVEDVMAIRLMKGRVKQRDIAKLFGISQSNVSVIQRGKSWERA